MANKTKYTIILDDVIREDLENVSRRLGFVPSVTIRYLIRRARHQSDRDLLSIVPR